ncbi:MAG: hypothetical protein R3B60_04130 [Candidatus Paceibacterota bacterium]
MNSIFAIISSVSDWLLGKARDEQLVAISKERADLKKNSVEFQYINLETIPIRQSLYIGTRMTFWVLLTFLIIWFFLVITDSIPSDFFCDYVFIYRLFFILFFN